MGVGSILLAVASLLLAVLYLPKMWELVKERKRVIGMVSRIPGPYSLPLIGTVWQFKWSQRELALQMRSWATHYRSLGHGVIRMWIGPKPMIFVSGADHMRSMLDNNELLRKGSEYNILIPWLGTGLLISTGEKWFRRRRMLTPTFHFKALNGFLHTHNKQGRILTEQLAELARTQKEFDIFSYLKRCALDIICETAMGTTANAQTDHENAYVLAVQRMSEISFKHERMPWLWLKPIWYASGYGFVYDRSLKTLTDFTRKVIDDKLTARRQGITSKSSGMERPAFLDMLIDFHEQGQLSYEDVREEVDTFMFEGHDTTASGMGWTTWCIAHQPGVLQKICDELDEIFGDSDRDCTDEDLKRMRYLEMCIKEGLRLFPPVPMITRTADKDTDISGIIVPKGCTVVCAIIMAHHSDQHFSHPETYWPEHFSEEEASARHPFAYSPFSAGPRNCIGQKFALMEEKTVLSWLFRRFRVYTDRPPNHSMPCPEIILKPDNGFPVFLVPRQSTAS